MFKSKKNNSVSFSVTSTLSTIIKQAFHVKRGSFPWSKALGAAVCSGLPIIIGILAGQLHLGLLGSVGSFSYLYVFNEPYAERAKKIFFVAIGISLSVALGTLAAPHPSLIILIVGFIGFIATFIFGVLKIPGPAAVFFVLSFIMTTGMPNDPSSAPLRFILVLGSGLFSWVISMIGWFFNPHGPEIRALKDVYSALARFSEAIGNDDISNIRQQTVEALNECEETLLTGYISWKNSFLYNRLSLLNEHANRLFLEMLELHFSKNTELPEDISEMIRTLGKGIDLEEGETIEIKLLSDELHGQYGYLLEIIYDAEAIINLPLTLIGHSIKISKPSLKMKLLNACDKDSIVFINSIRYGIILSLSTIIAFQIPFIRPYWITLSCAAVMLGSTILSTLHRAIQRSCGTIIGLMAAILIFKLEPQGFMIAVTNMCLIVLTELFIGKNYAVAVAFITPNALLIAENSTDIHNISYFVLARITDIFIGSVLGLVGTYFIGHRSASSRLTDLMVKLIRSQAQVLVCLSSNVTNYNNDNLKWIREKMKINFINFKMAYNTALGEIPNDNEMLAMMWPSVFSLEHISYLLYQGYTINGHLCLSDENLGKLLLAFENMAVSIEQKQVVQPKKVPILKEMPKICKEINALQDALSLRNNMKAVKAIK